MQTATVIVIFIISMTKLLDADWLIWIIKSDYTVIREHHIFSLIVCVSRFFLANYVT